MISLKDFEQQWLAEIIADHPTTVQLGNRFAQKLLKDWQEIDDATAEVILCDGSGDGGIDAAIFIKADPTEDVEGDTWLLIQSKYGSSFSGLETISNEAQKLFATLDGKRASLSSLSNELVQRLRIFLQNKGEKDKLEYILATSRKLSDEDQEYLDNVRVLGRSKFGESFDVDSISIETIYNKVCEEQNSASQLAVNLKASVAESTPDLLIGPTTLRNIFSFLHEYRSRSGDLDMLYERNVRKFLGNKRKVNRAIEKTLEESPERFGLYNNGITIVAERLNNKANGELLLVNPAIVNGCQTTRTIWNVLQRKLNAGGSSPSEDQKAWEKRLDRGVVVTKIVVVGPEGEQLLTDTTRYTNFQNAVGEKDFMALEKDFKNWSSVFNTRYGVFLEIQRGAWEARKAFQKQNPLAQPQFTEFANAFELLKTYAAGWLIEPGIAYGKNPPFAPGGSQFKRITNDSDFGVESL